MGRRSFGRILCCGKNADRYYVRIGHRGRYYERAAGPTKRIADRKLARLQALVADGKRMEEALAEIFGDRNGVRLTFRDAAPEYLKHAERVKRRSTYEVDVQRIETMRSTPWAGARLADVRPAQIRIWAEGLHAAGSSGSTVNRYLTLLSAFFGWAIEREYCAENPLSRVSRFPEPHGREVYLTAEEARTFIEACDPDIRPFVLVAVSTGMRRGELMSLRWQHIDMDRRTITIRPENEKTGRGRSIPMTDAVVQAITELRARSKVKQLDGSDPVFVRCNGKPFRIEWLRVRFLKARDRAALPEEKKRALRMHDLRHTAASLMVAQGVTIFDVANILGHATIQMTMRYAHFAPEAGRAAIQALGTKLALG